MIVFSSIQRFCLLGKNQMISSFGYQGFLLNHLRSMKQNTEERKRLLEKLIVQSWVMH